TLPILDTVGQHVYSFSSEHPWARHPNGRQISTGDVDSLVAALRDAFSGTGQPYPGQCVGGRCVSIWDLQAGFQTAPPAGKQSLYSGQENDSHTIPDAADGRTTAAQNTLGLAADARTQVRDALRTAYCLPYVGAYFNFLFEDQTDLSQWQSGFLWAD